MTDKDLNNKSDVQEPLKEVSLTLPSLLSDSVEQQYPFKRITSLNEDVLGSTVAKFQLESPVAKISSLEDVLGSTVAKFQLESPVAKISSLEDVLGSTVAKLQLGSPVSKLTSLAEQVIGFSGVRLQLATNTLSPSIRVPTASFGNYQKSLKPLASILHQSGISGVTELSKMVMEQSSFLSKEIAYSGISPSAGKLLSKAITNSQVNVKGNATDFSRTIGDLKLTTKLLASSPTINAEILDTVLKTSISSLDYKESKCIYTELNKVAEDADILEIENNGHKDLLILSDIEYKKRCYKLVMTLVIVLFSSTLETEEILSVIDSLFKYIGAIAGIVSVKQYFENKNNE